MSRLKEVMATRNLHAPKVTSSITNTPRLSRISLLIECDDLSITDTNKLIYHVHDA